MPRNLEEIKNKLNEVFCDVFDDETLQISEKMTAADVEDWDSVVHITLLVAIEEKFGIRFNVAEVGRLENVGEMIVLLNDREQKK